MNFPSRPITLIAPAVPGGSTDVEAFARRTVEAERATLARLGLLRKD
jgi:tripartite-type tricarboxylate transporter receptor subunit TctC